MYIDKTLFYEYGNITLAGFILLIGDATLQLLQKNKNGILYTTASLSLFLLIAVLIGILIIEPEATVVFDIAQLLVIAISLMTLFHFFLPGNTDQSK